MTEPYYADATVTVHAGDCLDVLRTLPDASVDAVVTDPPYGLEFMGREWDGADGFRRSLNPADSGRDNAFGRTSRTSPEYRAGSLFQEWCEAWSRECLRVLKPGGHLLAFGGTRTWHRLACAVEDAGFEVRDSIAWLYASGFPKSLDVSKAIDKRGGADIGWFGPWLREERKRRGISSNQLAQHFPSRTGGETGCVRNWELSLNLPTAEQFNTLCRVLDLPFAEIAEAEREVIGAHRAGLHTGTAGVGAGGIAGEITAPATDAARTWQGWGTALKPAFEPVVVARKPLAGTVAGNVLAHGTGALNIDGCRIDAGGDKLGGGQTSGSVKFAHDGWNRPWMEDPEVVARVAEDAKAAVAKAESLGRWPANVVLDEHAARELDQQSGDRPGFSGGGATPGEVANDVYGKGWQRNADPTLYGDSGGASRFYFTAKAATDERVRVAGVSHPTVKPLALMRWLVRLVTPPGGIVLEPFAGSGTTVEACILEGFRCVAIEREPDYLPLIVQRINRRRDPVAAVRDAGDDGGLFDLLAEEPA